MATELQLTNISNINFFSLNVVNSSNNNTTTTTNNNNNNNNNNNIVVRNPLVIYFRGFLLKIRRVSGCISFMTCRLSKKI